MMFDNTTYILVCHLFLGMQGESIEDVERLVIEERRRISSGVVEIESEISLSSNEQSNAQTTRATVSFTGEKFRIDRTATGSIFPPGAMEAVSISDGFYRYHLHSKLTNGAELITKQTADKNIDLRFQIPDPRRIGLNVTGFANLLTDSPTGFIGFRFRVARTELLKDERDGHQCDLLVYHATHGRGKVWVDRQRGNNVIAIVKEFGESHEEMNCELERVDDFGWFPSLISLLYFRDGAVQREEHIKIRVKQFNRPLSDKVFTFADMSVPVGHRIYDSSIVPTRTMLMQSDGTLKPEPPPPPSMNLRVLREEEGRRGLRYLYLMRLHFAP